MRELFFAATIFLSAFLLFQIQLILGKYLLPWFGGSPAVWTTCMLFFQLLLLAGYSYAHLLTQFAGKRQTLIHTSLLVLSVAVVGFAALHWRNPVLPPASWKPQAGMDPLLRILLTLGASIGVVFFVLSTTGPLLQKWFAEAHPGRSPYRLYAVSNLGSLLGLIGYPFVVEPHVRLSVQAWAWTATYCVFALTCVVVAHFTRRAAFDVVPRPDAIRPTPEAPADSAAPPTAHWVLWFLLAACASLLFLATTNLMTQDIAAVPLLWVLPLGIYLLSFILCFEGDLFYRRELWHPMLLFVLAMATVALFRSTLVRAGAQIYVFSLALFVCCMVCHGELSRLKPSPRYLTGFFLMIAAGGAAGGAFIALLAPLLFTGFWEYHIALFACAALTLVVLMLDRGSWIHHPRPWIAAAVLLVLALVPAYVQKLGLIGAPPSAQRWYWIVVGLLAMMTAAVGLLGGSSAGTGRRRHAAWVQLSALLVVGLLGYSLVQHARSRFGDIIARSRNFYGVLTVWELARRDPFQHAYVLANGRIRHGMQLRDPRYAMTATSYYGTQSGVGLALLYHPRRFAEDEAARSLRTGVIGLGAGTLAVYELPGDTMRFYEINPRVIQLAQGENGYFTFLKNAKGTTQVVAGDARLELEREAQRGEFQKFDVLVIDAFTSDAIPVHLLTREAFDIYQQHLRGPDSIIAVHISNKGLDLEPVVDRLARYFALRTLYIRSRSYGPAVSAADWVLLSHGQSMFFVPQIAKAGAPLDPAYKVPLWTDDYSNLTALLR